MRLIKIIQVLLLFYSINANAQDWPKIFGGTTDYWSRGLIETYDKGYLMDVQVDPGPGVAQMQGLLIKTDINGNKLWTKSVLSYSYQVAFFGFDNTDDGGIILTGATNKPDPSNYDIFFMKLNACGEKEWCKIISTLGNPDQGLKIKQSEHSYIALIQYFQDWVTKRIWLFKLDTEGNILWEQLLNRPNDSIENSEGYDFEILPDNNFVVAGDGYDRSSGAVAYLRPLVIKTDSNANVQWVLPYGRNSGFRGDIASFPRQNQSGFLYVAARHFRITQPYGDSPCFLKVSPTGQEVYYKDLIPDSYLGSSSTLLLKNNDSLFIGAIWQDTSDVISVGAIKCDTVANISRTRILLQNSQNSFGRLEDALFTYDNNYVTVGSFYPNNAIPKVYLYKFTSNLDDAPLNTQPRVYDSLCPHPIVSDTISLDDCAIITQVYDPVQAPEKFTIHVYPNPAKDELTIDLPQFLLRQTSSGTMQVNTIYHQWNFSKLEIYSQNGKLIYSGEIPKSKDKVKLDVSSWESGMYIARVVFMNEVVAKSTFIIQK